MSLLSRTSRLVKQRVPRSLTRPLFTRLAATSSSSSNTTTRSLSTATTTATTTSTSTPTSASTSTSNKGISPLLSAVGPNALVNYPLTQITRLSNGVRVASEPGYGETASVGVWIDTGSRYEDAATNGIAHFLEHMTFKGTAKRSRQNLELEIENMGGHLNAYTSREQTVFYAQVFKKDVPNVLELLSDILLNSKYDPADIERERGVIMREAEEVDKQLNEVIFDRLHETAYRGTALGRTILGPEDNIMSFTQQQLKDYVASHYTADRIVVAGAGVDHDQLVKLAEQHFGKFPSQATNGKPAYLQPASFLGSDIRIRFDSMPIAHVALAFPIAGWMDPDNATLQVIQTMLGSWDKSNVGGQHSISPLVAEVANADLAKSLMTFHTQYSDTGLFGIYATAEQYDLNDLMYAFTKHITQLSYEVDPKVLAAAKAQLKMHLLTQLDAGSQVTCEDIGRQVLSYGRRVHPSEALARIDAIDAEAVKRTATRYFFDRDFALAAIGPIYELPDYNWIRRRTYRLRY